MVKLLSEIQSLQSSNNDTIYPEGIYPSQRRIGRGIKREDDNSFFTALIVFTLKRLKEYFQADELLILEEIRQKAPKAFPRYKNKRGEPTYNFWRTEKKCTFPKR